MTFKAIRPGKISRKKNVNKTEKRSPTLRGQEEEPTKNTENNNQWSKRNTGGCGRQVMCIKKMS